MQVFSINNGTLKAIFLSYGATLHQLWIKDKYGKLVNVVKGLKNPHEYLLDNWCRGAVIGRYAGRLENPIQVEKKIINIHNKNGVLLHSGTNGWNKQDWKVVIDKNPNCIHFEHTCIEETAGFPGTVKAKVTYLLKDNTLCINYISKTDATTHVNLTNHSYFNLNGNSPIDEHLLQVKSDYILELKENLVPTGKMLKVDNTNFDFRTRKTINKIRLDDYFVLKSNEEEVACLYSHESGIEMKTFTNQPGIVIYTPPHFEAICFETQKFSNTPNINHFPSTLLKPGEIYDHQTKYQFVLK